MDQPPTPQAPGPGRPRASPGPLRWLRRIGLALVALLVLAAIVLWTAQGWLIDRALQYAVQASDGRLVLTNAHAGLRGELSADALAWHGPDGLSVEVHGLRGSLRLLDLLQRRLHVGALSAETVEVRTVPSSEPAVLPDSLALPIGLEVRDLSIGRFTLAGPEPLEFERISAAFGYSRGQWRVERLSLATPWGDLRADGQLAGRAPFALAARVAADLRLRGLYAPLPETFPATLQASGTLGSIALALSASVHDAQLAARTTLAPFDPGAGARIDADLSAFDAARFGADLPRTALAGKLVATLAAGLPVEGARLDVDLANAASGRIDERRVPIKSLKVTLGWAGERLSADGLEARGDAGEVTGSVSLQPGALLPQLIEGLRGALVLRGVDAARLHGSAVPTALDGRIGAADGALRIDVADAGPVLDGGLALRATLRRDGDAVAIEGGELKARNGVLRVDGKVGFDDRRSLALRGTAEGFEPQRWVQLALPPSNRPLAGRIDGRWDVTGQLLPSLQLAVGAVLKDSVLDERPLAGEVRGTLRMSAASGTQPATPESVRDVDARLTWGGTRLQAQGGLGTPADRLRVRLEARSLAEWLPTVEGSATVDATLAGSLLRPSIQGRATLGGLASAGIGSVVALDGEFEAADLDRGRLALRLKARGLAASGVAVESAALNLDGTLADHRLDLQATYRGTTLALAGQSLLTLPAAGAPPAATSSPAPSPSVAPTPSPAPPAPGGSPAPAAATPSAPASAPPWRWQLRLQSLQTTGRLQAQLRAPALVDVAADHAAVSDVDLAIAGGRVLVASARYGIADRRGAVKARIEQLQVDALMQAANRLAPDSLEPEWLRPTGLSVNGDVDLAGSGLDDVDGSIGLDAKSTLVEGDSRARIALAASRLSGSVALRVPSLRWAQPFLGDDWRADGRLRVDADLGGSLRAPQLNGALEGSDLQVTQRLLGLKLTDGVLSARLDGDRFELRTLRFTSNRGTVELSGGIALPAKVALGDGKLDLGQGALTLKADRLPLVYGPGQRVVVSGTARADVAGPAVRISGRLVADEGFVEVRDLESPSLPDDIVIVDRRKPQPAATAEPRSAGGRRAQRALPVVLSAQLELDLGEKFRVTGSGLDARLAGTITVSGTLPEAPRATGTVEVRDGRYDAYGRTLEIERGKVIFNGPLEDPLLDIVAYRRYQQVEAGVSITGSAQSPRVTLVSRPDVPDAEKLSWLVFGTGLDGASGGAQALALQAAAARILGKDNPTSGGIARTLGLDVVSVGQTGGGTPRYIAGADAVIPGTPGAGTSSTGSTSASSSVQQNVVTFGKRLSSRLYVSYEQGLRGAWNLLRVQYDLTNRLSLRGQTGSESALDLLYFWTFD